MLRSKNFFIVLVCLMSIATVPAFAQKAFQRAGGSYVKTSLNAFSFSKMLNYYNKTQKRDSGMSMFDMLEYAAKQNFDAVDLTGYFFPGYPAVPSDDYINSVKRRAFQLGLD